MPESRSEASGSTAESGLRAADRLMRRLQRELLSIQREGVSPTVHVAAHSEDLTILEALVIGPAGTPYDSGMFHFQLQVPPEYPLLPPQVRFMTTDGGNIRFHPQLYADGKVCLSILNTWQGPQWHAGMSLRSVLLSIQSLLNDEPLRCEPGFENKSKEEVEKANVFVVHETMRIATLGAVSASVPSWGTSEDFVGLTAAMHEHLAERRPALVERLEELAPCCDGKVFSNPFVFGALGSTYAWATEHRRFSFADLAENMGKLQLSVPIDQQGDTDGVDDSSVHCASAASDVSPASASVSLCHRGNPDGDAGRDAGVLRCRKQRSRTSGTEAVAVETPRCDEEDEPGRCCRICHISAEESDCEPLVEPCACSGSMRWVHSQCLVNWLQHSPGRQRCDICRYHFRVRLGGGRPVGSAYLRRAVDDPTFDASGLLAILVISMVQMLVTTFGFLLTTCYVQMLEAVSGVFDMVTPQFAMPCKKVVALCAYIPVALAEFGIANFYIAHVLMKAAILMWGSRWRPSAWGSFGDCYVAPYLERVQLMLADFGIRLQGLAFFTSVVSLKCFLQNMFLRFLTWREKGSASIHSLLPALGVLAPSWEPAVHQIYAKASWASLTLNSLALMWLLKRAYLDCHPVPVEVFSREPHTT